MFQLIISHLFYVLFNFLQLLLSYRRLELGTKAQAGHGLCVRMTHAWWWKIINRFLFENGYCSRNGTRRLVTLLMSAGKC